MCDSEEDDRVNYGDLDNDDEDQERERLEIFRTKIDRGRQEFTLQALAYNRDQFFNLKSAGVSNLQLDSGSSANMPRPNRSHRPSYLRSKLENFKCSLDSKALNYFKSFLPCFRTRFRIDFVTGECGHGPHSNASQTGGGDSTSMTRSGSSKSSLASLPESANIAFHFNPRFNEAGGKNIVVMNSRIGGKDGWGEEIKCENFPFEHQRPFALMILVEQDSFKVAVNGKHAYDFKHRCDFKDVGKLFQQPKHFFSIIFRIQQSTFTLRAVLQWK